MRFPLSQGIERMKGNTQKWVTLANHLQESLLCRKIEEKKVRIEQSMAYYYFLTKVCSQLYEEVRSRASCGVSFTVLAINILSFLLLLFS